MPVSRCRVPRPVSGREVTRTLVDDIEVELGEEVCDPLSFVVVWHGGSFPRLLRLPNNILLKERDDPMGRPFSVNGDVFSVGG